MSGGDDQLLDNQLVESAKSAREFAVASFSNFRVGAALVSDTNVIFTGCNIENATYGLTVCAERVAIWKALSEGARKFKRIALVADTETLTPPCGACRQLIWEFCGDVAVVLANLRGDVDIYQMHDLLPHAFDATLLHKPELIR